MSEDRYPPTPREVPPDLAAPTAAYRRRAWLAFATLVAFVALYLGLLGYLGWLTYRLVEDFFATGDVLKLAFAAPPAFFCAFLITGLFVVKRAKEERALLEVKPEDEPVLFAFLHRLADEAGAPKPHRVFLSPEVNACVFYDLSFFNLLFPSKKNLEIGLGLVNVLSLDEIKAVIAHELGHFAQRTMAVGRWVYVADQIAGNVIVGRTWLDGLLGWISSIDLRVAWIGWIMRLWVWSLRAILDTAFRGIVLAQRALSREMELQADLVAVSLSGSDSLIHALHRLGAADEAWEYTLSFANREIAQKRTPVDLFEVQRRALEGIGTVIGDRAFGASPVLPEIGRERHRVFEAALAQPPRMWSTHPPNHEREDNAKKLYIPSPLDPRSAWLLFQDPERTRREATRVLWKPDVEIPAPVEMSETIERLEAELGRRPLHARYRGAYLGRSIVEHAESAHQLYDAPGDDVVARLDALYPETLRKDLDRVADLRRDHALLTALSDGVLMAPGGVIRHRGEVIPRKALSGVIDRVKGERDEAEALVRAHDRACRSVHRDAARKVGGGWEDYLVGLLELLHYVDHTQADLRDASGHLHHVLSIVLADGQVTDGERQRVLDAAHEVWRVLSRAFDQRDEVFLPDAIEHAIADDEGWKHWRDEKFDLPEPHPQDLGDWLGVIDSWVFIATDGLGALLDATLSALLEAEDRVARAVRDGEDAGPAPEAPEVPEQYPVLLLGKERERQQKLDWWSRFQLADGIVPGTARFAVASALLAPAFLVSVGTGEATVHVHNGLGIPVEVTIGDEEQTVDPGSSATIETERGDVMVTARALDGRTIERFEADADGDDFVYNVAGASPLVVWTAVYGGGAPMPEQRLGAPRWTETNVDYVLGEPPRSLSTSRSSGGATRAVLQAVADAPPYFQAQAVERESEREAMIAAHLRFDPPDDPNLNDWAELASSPHDLGRIVRARAAREPGVIWERMLQDHVDHETACARHREAAERDPDDADMAYLAARCIVDEEEQEAAFRAAYTRHRDHPWLSMVAAYDLAEQAEWAPAEEAFERCHARSELGPIREQLVLDEARVRRMAFGEAADLDDLAQLSSPLAELVALERAPVPYFDPEVDLAQTRNEPWRLLARGELEEAVLRAAAIDEGFGYVILRLAAASEGAPESLRERAWSLPPDAGIVPITLWSTLALAVRASRDTAPLIEHARAFAPDDHEAMLSVLDVRDAAQMEARLAGLTPVLRGHALVMGIVLMEDAAPEPWRRDAGRLLFSGERPYFRAATSPDD